MFIQRPISKWSIFAGPNCIQEFILKMLDIQKEYVKTPAVPIIMTPEDDINYLAATTCYLCNKSFSSEKGKSKCRDHDHNTGKFRGAAHQDCNLGLQVTNKLNVFFHSGKTYDFHFLVERFGEIFYENKPLNIEVIAENKEKFKQIIVNDAVVFKDTYQFMPDKLENLVKCNKGKFTLYHKRTIAEEGHLPL